MTRKAIIAKVMETGLTHNAAKAAVDTFLAGIANAMGGGDYVKLSGFGTFYIKNKKARRGMNPKTGERIQVQAKKYPAFCASPELRLLINE